MKVIMVSRTFPAQHPRHGQPTGFVEKIFNCFRGDSFELPDSMIAGADNYSTLLKGDEYLKAIQVTGNKIHTIRAGTRFAAGDCASLRVWSGKPRRSKQVEFAQVEVRRVIPIQIFAGGGSLQVKMDSLYSNNHELIARNDGLSLQDFIDWFQIHPNNKSNLFTGQIICWQDPKY